MKSVGEVMAIGRSFPEALQKAVRMLNIGASGLTDYPHSLDNPKKEISCATDRRLFALYQFFKKGGTVERSTSSFANLLLGFFLIFKRLQIVKLQLKKDLFLLSFYEKLRGLDFLIRLLASLSTWMKIRCAS